MQVQILDKAWKGFEIFFMKFKKFKKNLILQPIEECKKLKWVCSWCPADSFQIFPKCCCLYCKIYKIYTDSIWYCCYWSLLYVLKLISSFGAEFLSILITGVHCSKLAIICTMYYFEQTKFGKFEGSGCKFSLQTCARCIRLLFTTWNTPLMTFSFKSKAQNRFVKCQLFGCFLWMVVDI